MPDSIAKPIANAVDCEGTAAIRRQSLISEGMIPGLVGFVEVVVVVTAGLIIHGLRNGWGSAGLDMYLAATLLMGAFVVSLFRAGGLYDFDSIAAWPRHTGSMFVRVAVVALLLTGLGFAFKISDQFSRVWLTTTTATSAALIWGLRGVVAARVLRAAKAGGILRNFAVVGAGNQAERLLIHFRERNAPWMNIVGVFDDRETRIGTEIASVPIRGTIADLFAAVRRSEIDAVVITLPWAAEERIVALIMVLRDLPVSVYVGADLISYRMGTNSRTVAGGISVLEASRVPLDGWNGVIKAVEDKVLAAVGLLVFSPLLVIIAVLIKLDSPGPVLFRQWRSGFNNGPIEILKFRTMYHNRPEGDASVQAKKNDSRVTRIGRFFRRTSLDELPQLFNVWNGTMSMVGPRPHLIEHNQHFERLLTGYNFRHKVKPGITGLAQVNGWRGETDTLEKMHARVEHDVRYIETWSLWLDIRILFATAFLGWFHQNAY